MIDTDKYEGHTPAPWKWLTRDNFFSLIVEGPERFEIEGPLPYLDRETNPTADRMFADAQLIADAPLLLAEVKKIRGIIKNALTYLEGSTRMSDTVKLKFLIDDIRRYVLHEGDEQE